MLSMPPVRSQPVARPSVWLQRVAHSLLLGFGASVFWFSNGSSYAAERIILKLETTQVTIPVATLEEFVRTGNAKLPELQDFLQKNPKLEKIMRDVLGKQINISRISAERFFKSSTGEFVLTQIDRLLTTPAGSPGLESARMAILNSYQEDNRFSLLEVVQNYPGKDLQLDVSVVERVYDDVSAFVERIQPALEAVKGVLQDFVCDCEKPSAMDTPDAPQASADNPKGLANDLGARGATPAQVERSSCVKPAQAATPTIAPRSN